MRWNSRSNNGAYNITYSGLPFTSINVGNMNTPIYVGGSEGFSCNNSDRTHIGGSVYVNNTGGQFRVSNTTGSSEISFSGAYGSTGAGYIYWGGSYYVERLTHDLAKKALQHIDEIEDLGGMAKAIEAGIPKMRIEEAAARTQARIDSGRQVIVGVNRYAAQDDVKIDVLKVDNALVRNKQLDKLARNRAERDNSIVMEKLKNLTRAAENNTGNLLELAVDAARVNATVGEITSSLEEIYGRHVANVKTVSGIYTSEVGKDNEMTNAVSHLVDNFQNSEGRRPRILIAKMGQDGHDRGQKVIASAFADLGFDVDIGALFQTPNEVVNQALINDVHIIGISSLAAGHTTNVPEIIRLLKKYNREDILIVLGGVIVSITIWSSQQTRFREVFASRWHSTNVERIHRYRGCSIVLQL